MTVTDVSKTCAVVIFRVAQVVETSFTVNNNIPIQDYVHPDDQTKPTFLCDFFTNFGYAVINIFHVWNLVKFRTEKNISEVTWLVLFLYNKMSIKNSFVQCPIVCDL